MATSTFGPIACNTAGWALVVDGAAYKSFVLQVQSNIPVAVFIGTTAPALGSQAYVILTRGDEGSLALDLSPSDKVYARVPDGFVSASQVSGARVSV